MGLDSPDSAGRPIRLFAVRSRPESLDDFEPLALGFPEIDDLALPAGLRVEPPSAGDRSGNQNAEIDQLLDRPTDIRRSHPEGLGDFDLWDADDVVEVETGVEVHENPVDLQPDVTPGGELFEEMLVDLHPIFTVRAVDLGPTEYRNPLVKFAVLVHAADDFSFSHLALPQSSYL